MRQGPGPSPGARIGAALALLSTLCALLGCAPLAGEGARRDEAGELHFYVREITKGEMALLKLVETKAKDRRFKLAIAAVFGALAA